MQRPTDGNPPTSDRVPDPDRQRLPPPASLVDGDGFRFGTYSDPVADVDVLRRWSGPARRAHGTRLKEWQAFQLGDGEHFVLGAVYDAKLLGLVQLVVVHMATGRLRRWEHRVPSAALRVARGLHRTRSRGAWRGLEVSFTNDVVERSLRIRASQRPRPGGAPAMTLDVDGRWAPEGGDHLVICHPFADGTPLYSDKSLLSASATLTVEHDPPVTFHRDTSFLLLDDHKGHYPSPMRYDWVTGARHDPGGPAVAFNLTANQVVDPEIHNENALFVDGAVHRLPPVTFTRPGGVHHPWTVSDAQGRVDVTFEPSVRNEQHVGPRSALADYYGPFGWFEGTIEPEDGPATVVDGYFGMGEQKFIRF